MTDDPPRDPHLARRRYVLYGASSIALLLILALAVVPRLQTNSAPKPKMAPTKPVILARVDLKAVGTGRQSGLAEILRRGREQSLRFLAVGLRPNRRGEAYQLVLAGGSGERLLGTAVVGRQRVFVGEAKVGINEIERHRRVELRRVTRGPDARATLVLRGRLPR